MTALFIIRTPLQSWIAESVRSLECVNSFGLIYVTVDDAVEDRYCFSRISRYAKCARYIVAPPRRPDFFHQVELAFKLHVIGRRLGRDVDCVFLASFDSHAINSFVSNLQNAEVVTFDDGTANINQGGKYSVNTMTEREKLYRRLLGGISNAEFLRRVARHYTIFGNASHLMPRDRLITLGSIVSTTEERSSEVARYFIGQPLEEVLSQAQIERLKERLKNEGIEWYVTHPREKEPIDLGGNVRRVDKKGEIAERAIDDHASGRQIWLYGWFSTVMFTMRPIAEKRFVFLPKDSEKTPELGRLAISAGCEVIEF